MSSLRLLWKDAVSLTIPSGTTFVFSAKVLKVSAFICEKWLLKLIAARKSLNVQDILILRTSLIVTYVVKKIYGLRYLVNSMISLL